MRRNARKMLLKFCVHVVGDWLEPFVVRTFARDFHGKVLKPTVRRGSVPVLYARRNVHTVAGIQRDRFFAPFLIPAAPRRADEDLPAAFFRVVDVPVVAAARLERHGENADLLRGDRPEIALPDEILRERIVWLARIVRRLLGEFFKCHLFFSLFIFRLCGEGGCERDHRKRDKNNFFHVRHSSVSFRASIPRRNMRQSRRRLSGNPRP